jgi:hypothetical protein
VPSNLRAFVAIFMAEYNKIGLSPNYFQNHQVIRKMKPHKIGKRLSEKVLRNAQIGREQALPVPQMPRWNRL